ncbi:coiled-coil domain-containing protein 134-like [Corticium candelabrum]|uniref:coiled-coil domain-containing protein 134-like n=1 Tax=Corticium candelabrum TaxID=121492 RepID=UPI002E26F27E|nr:coiled-coil domain-containing protein 134-like [Corticium candelabrum]
MLVSVAVRFCTIGLLLSLTLVVTSTESEASSEVTPVSVSQKDIYRRLLKHKRQDHALAVKTISQIDDFVKQYRMIELVLDKLFQVLADARVQINVSGWQPDMPFPDNEKDREAVAQVIENTLLFGDILLRIPDMTHEIYKSQTRRRELVIWSLQLCNETDVFEHAERKLLNLMSQELGVIPMEEDYINPYRIKLKKPSAPQKTPKKKQRQPREKKPRLGGRRLEL